jgi:hypothetical protein
MRFFRYRAHLEAELLNQARLYGIVISTKDRVIQWQVDELQRLRAKVDRLELALTPPPRISDKQPPKAKEVALESETSWNLFLNRFMREEEERIKKEHENVPVENRAGLHESTGSDAARPDGGTTETRTGKTKPA